MGRLGKLRGFLKGLVVAPPPAGEPFRIGGEHVGTWLADGSLQLLPGYSISFLTSSGQEEFYKAYQRQREAKALVKTWSREIEAALLRIFRTPAPGPRRTRRAHRPRTRSLYRRQSWS